MRAAPAGAVRPTTHAPASRPGSPSGRLLPVDDALDPSQEARFDALREWRRTRAARDGVPPFIVFHDSHLRAIAVAAPTSLVDLSGVAGVGATKLDRYGDEILELLDEAG
jgi:ATP-dependent DNA helicase RecQ